MDAPQIQYARTSDGSEHLFLKMLSALAAQGIR